MLKVKHISAAILLVAATAAHAADSNTLPGDKGMASVNKNLKQNPDNKGLQNASEQLKQNQEKHREQVQKRTENREQHMEQHTERHDTMGRPSKPERPGK